ncbi:MAG: hypothetical protein P1P84_06100 [Deferrisomatales bacterium]|nr:hypothetical protein [Deferrisomatales bacterium]
MKRMICTTVTILALAAPVLAMDHGKMGDMDHGKTGAMDHSKMGDMDHSEHQGEMIRETTVDGYQLAYHLIDNMAAMAKMDDMKGHDMSKMKSNHLMLYIVDGSGKAVAEGKVGYKVTGPDGKDQQTMAMAMRSGMSAGFGADVDFKAKGTYTIKTKAVAGETKLMDEFTYEVK